MKLYRVYNGYTGNGPVHCLVIAHDEREAVAAARPAFRKEAENRYPETYWEELEAEQLCEDTSLPYLGPIEDD